MDTPIPTHRVGKGSWFGCNIKEGMTPGGFSTFFHGKSRSRDGHRFRARAPRSRVHEEVEQEAVPVVVAE